MADNIGLAKFSLADGRIEIEGPETFVSEQLEKLQPWLVKMFERSQSGASAPPSDDSEGKNVPAASSPATPPESDLDGYLSLFALSDGKVQILKSLPGTSKSSKTQNAILLVAYANMLRGVNATFVKEIRTICASHACYDAPNFAKVFKGKFGKESLTLSGSGEAQTLSLTYPGKLKAQALADSLNQ